MALKPCKECGNGVAIGAEKCPHCGTKWPAGKKTSMLTWGCLGFFVLWLIGGIVSQFDKPSPVSTPPPPSHPSSGAAHFKAGGGMVYSSAAAMDKGMDMIARGVHKTHVELLFPLMECVLTDSAEANLTVLGMTMGRREVIIDSGKHKGCRGWTVMENVVP